MAGGVCKRQGLIQRKILIYVYYGLLIHKNDFQFLILTEIDFSEITSSLQIRNFLYQPL